METELDALAVFARVAEARSFRAAADRLGVTRSAVSQTIRRLEERVGTALLQRTTRSVHLTETGRLLLEQAAPALADLEAALAAARDARGVPHGQLRLAVSSIAEAFLDGPMLAGFAAAHPQVQLDVTVTDEAFDIVAEGYDAGVRLGELIAQDMIAVPVSAEQRQIVVAAPDYLARHGAPAHPAELAGHRCIGWRPGPGLAPYRWEFTEGEREFRVDVAPEITTNDMALMVKLALSGAGLSCGMEETFRPHLAAGRLVRVLEAFCPLFAGFFLYYPNRRAMAPKLRALIDHARWRG
ncbi:LysR family transcriptional regulator [Xanthobacteraceae bacterium A53D]